MTSDEEQDDIPEAWQRVLDEAMNDPELLATISPVVAAGFGVLPLRRQGNVLAVACCPDIHAPALRLLRTIVGLEITAKPIDSWPLRKAISKAYFPQDESLNFPTFLDPSFLERPEAAEVLKREKVERLGRCGVELEPSHVTLAAFTYRGQLWNHDDRSPRRRFASGRMAPRERRDDPLLWARDPRTGRPIAHAAALGSGAGAILVEYRFSDQFERAGALYSEHVVRSSALPADALPHVVHPSEVQLLRVERDGALVFHAYDREVRAAPGARSAFELAYYFLCHGSLLRREIEVAVHEVVVAERALVEGRPVAPSWGPVEVARFFGIA